MKNFGRYMTTGVLARTEYADVYEAENDAGERFALKALRVEGIEPALVEALFEREIAALDGFQHEGIVPLRDHHRAADGTPVLVFDLVRGARTLETFLQGAMDGADTRDACWRITQAKRLVDAVGAAHARKVVHRDLKPANVLFDVHADRLVVCDFGVANVLLHRIMNPGGRTLRDLFTRPYAAPEQRLHGEALYPADVYALSILVTGLVGLRLPADDFGLTTFDDLWSPAMDELTAAAARDAAVARLGETLRDGLAEAPARRPTLHALGAALEDVRASIAPRPVATLWLAESVRRKLAEEEMTPVDLCDDLNGDLAIRLDDGRDGPRVKMYGQRVVAVAVESTDGSAGLIDVKVLTGPRLANDRRNAHPVALSVRTGHGDGRALFQAAREARGLLQSRRVNELLDVASRVIELERERLPVIEVSGEILNGTPVTTAPEMRIAQASGHATSSADRVIVQKNARVRVRSTRRVCDGRAMSREEIASLFDTPDKMQAVDPESHHDLGKVTAWNAEPGKPVAATVELSRPKASLPRRFTFHMEDGIQKRQLTVMDQALDQLRSGGARLTALPDLLTLTSAHTLERRREIEPFQAFLKADRSVRDIVERVLASNLACVQGPPGTGKTTLIVELVLQLLSTNPRLRILVCSQANEAVSNALERLQEDAVGRLLPTPPWVVRDVRSEIRDEARHEGLEPMFRRVARDWINRAREARKEVTSDAARRAVDEWCRDLENGAAGTQEAFAAHVQVWGATTARSRRTLGLAQATDWDVVIVDEAAKITVAEVLVPLVDARRIVLVGDHRQLPPFLESHTAERLDELGLDPDDAKRSLFQHLFEDVLPASHKGEMLTQSRMHPSIGAIVSTLFYDGKLRHNVKHEDRPLPAGRFDRAHRVLFLGFKGIDEQTREGSRRNRKEATEVRRVLEELDREAARARHRLVVNVITPYKAQAADLAGVAERKWESLAGVRAGTVNSFQGRQADVIVYSLVRTGATEWNFLADPRLFNVAMSRARSLLVLVGDLEGAPATPLLARLLALVPDANRLRIEDFFR